MSVNKALLDFDLLHVFNITDVTAFVRCTCSLLNPYERFWGFTCRFTCRLHDPYPYTISGAPVPYIRKLIMASGIARGRVRTTTTATATTSPTMAESRNMAAITETRLNLYSSVFCGLAP